MESVDELRSHLSSYREDRFFRLSYLMRVSDEEIATYMQLDEASGEVEALREQVLQRLESGLGKPEDEIEEKLREIGKGYQERVSQPLSPEDEEAARQAFDDAASIHRLLPDLQSSQPENRVAAIEDIAERSNVPFPAVEKLSDRLHDESGEVRRSAAAALGKIGTASLDVLEELIGRLADDSASVRKAAAQALGRLGGGPEVTAALSDLLNDSSAQVREAAEKALAELESEEQTFLERIQALPERLQKLPGRFLEGLLDEHGDKIDQIAAGAIATFNPSSLGGSVAAPETFEDAGEEQAEIPLDFEKEGFQGWLVPEGEGRWRLVVEVHRTDPEGDRLEYEFFAPTGETLREGTFALKKFKEGVYEGRVTVNLPEFPSGAEPGVRVDFESEN